MNWLIQLDGILALLLGRLVLRDCIQEFQTQGMLGGAFWERSVDSSLPFSARGEADTHGQTKNTRNGLRPTLTRGSSMARAPGEHAGQ